MIYIGIDPGKNGGIALIKTTQEKLVDVKTRVFDESVLVNVLDELQYSYCCKCVVEKVSARPGQGVVSMFNFGQNFGFIQGVLKAYRMPFQLVPSPVWKKEFSVTSDKNTSIEVAKRLFPDVNLKATERCKKDHDGMAEALLMAEYARRKL